MGKYLSVLSEVSEKQPLIPYARQKKSADTYFQAVPKVPKVTPAPNNADFWREAAQAIQDARRGHHLAYTPALARVWKAANAFTGRNLTSAQLCEVALNSGHEPQE
jgi:hypothetical protein